MKLAAPLLARIDRIHAVARDNFLLPLILQEIREVFPEISTGSHTKTAKELADVQVFVLSRILAGEGSVDGPVQAARKANGVGGGSNAFELLLEVGKNLTDDVDAGLSEITAISWSIMQHIPGGVLAAVEAFEKVITKVLSNRPPELYNTYDIDRRPLSDQECIDKYQYLEKCLRLLRDTVGRTLVEEDWRPYAHFLNKYWKFGVNEGFLVFSGLLRGTLSQGGVYTVPSIKKM